MAKGLLRVFCVLTCLLSMALPSHAQLDNSFFDESKRLNPADSGRIDLWLQGLTYFRNNEYFNPPLVGYTYLGYQFSPRLSWQLGPRLRAEGGFFMRQEIGDQPLVRQLLPVFTLQAQLDSLEVIMGTLQGGLSHGLIEPLYNFENQITRRNEQGLQLRYRRGRLHTDTWLNWLRYLPAGAPYQEAFMVGSVNRFTLLRPAVPRHTGIDLLLQFTFNHSGGQIDTDTLPGYVSRQLAPGFSLYTGRNPQVRLDYWWVGHNSNQMELVYSKGYGHYPNVSVNWTHLRLMASYWHGRTYQGEWGSGIYQSVPTVPLQPDFRMPNRHVVVFRLMYETRLWNRSGIAFRLEPIYDAVGNTWDYNYGVYINLMQPATLGRLVPRLD